jgi:hypothetical protein
METGREIEAPENIHMNRQEEELGVLTQEAHAGGEYPGGDFPELRSGGHAPEDRVPDR